ncbi:FAD-binding protein [Bradyrhizobium yuanmingense]|uniref:FAD-binding protein n=1 Tax=Bradyrhizobium yuanmingense TaxID=108015 RepID=UPI0023B9622A|nr:FAD-binding protein [Bradyrhizobium yuanmingense]MDF0518655.1 FAD-binding protein [Bradyrhizobium yuanmingense]MDF0579793.1 FAD-binding protein [Bradyrhizobium yuanmingense]
MWAQLADHADTGTIASRETAALLATARWSVATAAARKESRGLHRREDFPSRDCGLAVRLLSGGLDQVWVAVDGAPADTKTGQLEVAS